MNQPVDPLTLIMDDQPSFTPALAVLSGESKHKPTGQSLTGFHESTSTLTVAAYCPPSARVTIDGREIEIQGNGPLAAFVLDTMLYQARMALLAPDNPWGRLWSRFVTKVDEISISPPWLEMGAGEARVFMRGMVLDYCPLRDPAFGRPMTESWQALHDLMLMDPGLRALAPLMKGAIETPEITPDWQFAIMQLGLSDAAALNTGIAPLEPTGVPITEIGTYDTDPVDGEVIAPDDNEGSS